MVSSWVPKIARAIAGAAGSAADAFVLVGAITTLSADTNIGVFTWLLIGCGLAVRPRNDGRDGVGVPCRQVVRGSNRGVGSIASRVRGVLEIRPMPPWVSGRQLQSAVHDHLVVCSDWPGADPPGARPGGSRAILPAIPGNAATAATPLFAPLRRGNREESLGADREAAVATHPQQPPWPAPPGADHRYQSTSTTAQYPRVASIPTSHPMAASRTGRFSLSPECSPSRRADPEAVLGDRPRRDGSGCLTRGVRVA